MIKWRWLVSDGDSRNESQTNNNIGNLLENNDLKDWISIKNITHTEIVVSPHIVYVIRKILCLLSDDGWFNFGMLVICLVCDEFHEYLW